MANSTQVVSLICLPVHAASTLFLPQLLPTWLLLYNKVMTNVQPGRTYNDNIVHAHPGNRTHTHISLITIHEPQHTTRTRVSRKQDVYKERKKKNTFLGSLFCPVPPVCVCVTRRTWDVDTDRGPGGGATATLLEAQQRKLMHMSPWMTLGSRKGPDRRRREICTYMYPSARTKLPEHC